MNSPAFLKVHYLDGRQSRLRPARLRWVEGGIHLSGDGFERVLQLSEIIWPENMGQPVRVAQLNDGGQLQSISVAQWEAWLASHSVKKSWIAKAQVSRKWAAAAVLGIALFAFGFWRWGMDWAAEQALYLTPTSIDASVGASTLAVMDGTLLQPSTLTAEQKAEVMRRFDAVVAAVQQIQQRPDTSYPLNRPHYVLHFRSSVIGPNAFAIPGGGVIMTDEMVILLQDAPDAIAGVLGHEIGHVIHRHGMLLAYKSGAVALISDFLLGDVSSMLATLPALLSQASYSRDAERQADQVAADVLTQMGRSPLAMVTLFEKLQVFFNQRSGHSDTAPDKLGISFSSHPSDADRIDFFKKRASQ